MKSRYEVGLSKLDNAAADVSVMQEALEALQPQLVVAAAKVEVTVTQVAKEKAEAGEVEAIVMIDEKMANEQVQYLNTFQKDLSRSCSYGIL